MHWPRRARLALFAGLAACGCDAALGFGPNAERDVEGIIVTLTASAPAVEPGEEVRLTVAAHNSTGRRVQIGFQCGPALDAVFRQGDGSWRSVLAEMLGDGAFTCELSERHFADPGEIETTELVWRASLTRGTYTFVGGLRAAGGELSNLSAPIQIIVR